VTKARTRPYKPKIHAVEDIVEVPPIKDMDDETFLKHLELRHAQDTGVETHHTHAMSAWMNVYRTFHEKIHELATPGQHDHVHEEDE
jgi:hypothetical protein